MSDEQVKFYAGFFSRATRGWLYSYNARKQFMNTELHRYVDDVLGDYFVGGPNELQYRDAGIDQIDQAAKRIFLGFSRELSAPPKREPRSNLAWVADKPIRVLF